MLILETQRLAIQSKPSEIRKVERFIDGICDYFNINNDYFGNILIAVTEAVNNAIYHGNAGDPTKRVGIAFEAKNKNLYFNISDEGTGFDITNISDPTDPNVEYPGKGIYLMKHLADEVEFRENGRIASLKFSIASIHNKIADARIQEFKKHLEQNPVIPQNDKTISPDATISDMMS